MVECNVTKSLINMSKGLDFKTQARLRKVEDKYVYQRMVNLLPNVTNKVRNYILLTSMPWAIARHLPNHYDLDDIWPIECKICPTVIHRKVVPYGNVAPTYMLVGEAASVVGDKLKEGEFERSWVYRPSSIMLRNALHKLDMLQWCWFSNSCKCSMPNNRQPTMLEAKMCSQFLNNEIRLLNPAVVLLLGTAVLRIFSELYNTKRYKDTRFISIRHPGYAVRMGWTSDQYAEHIDNSFRR